MGPVVSLVLIGIANFAIYMATIDYMVAAYGPRAASATGGNGFCRDLFAGIAALYGRPMFMNIMHGTEWQLVIPSLILSGIAVLLCIPVYVFYLKGEWFRKRSPYASELEKQREEVQEQREEAIRDSKDGSPTASRLQSRAQSRRASLDDVRQESAEDKELTTPTVTEKDGSSSFHA
jgi:hypothetical protein